MYNLGIDIGIASIGFAGVDLENQKILFCGSHIFEAAENPKDGSSLAIPRREKRGQRRVIARRRTRKKAIRRLLAKHDIREISAIDKKGKIVTNSVWDLRKEALERKLDDAEFARVLFHIAKRRGFQSNSKSGEPNDTDGRKALDGARSLQEAMIRANSLTIGSYLAGLSKQRNGDGDYSRFVTRDLLREEINLIFKAQRKFGNEKATEKLQYEYAGDGTYANRNTLEGDGIAFYQRPLESSEKLVGYCTLEPDEKRACKFSYTAELFVLWGKLNNCRIKSHNGEERPLSQDEKNRLNNLAHKNKGGVTYKQARKELELSDNERFNISYRKIKEEDNNWDKIRDNAEKSVFFKLTGYHELKSALFTGSEIEWQTWVTSKRDDLDEIARILSFNEDKKALDILLSELGFNKKQIESLCKIKSFSRTVDLSLKAIRNILPLMQEGKRYDEACRLTGYDHSRKEKDIAELIPPFEDIRNPVVNRAMA